MQLTKPTILIISFIVLFIYASTAKAESAKYELGTAMAKYIESQDLIVQLKYSKCGYLIKIKTKSYEDLKNEILNAVNPKLNEKERSQLLGAYNNQYQRLNQLNKAAIDNHLKLSLEGGMDDKSACGLFVGAVSPQYQQALNDWERLTK